MSEIDLSGVEAEVKALREWRTLVCEAAGGAPPKDVPELVAKIGRRYVERADEIRDLRAKLAQAEAERDEARKERKWQEAAEEYSSRLASVVAFIWAAGSPKTWSTLGVREQVFSKMRDDDRYSAVRLVARFEGQAVALAERDEARAKLARAESEARAQREADAQRLLGMVQDRDGRLAKAEAELADLHAVVEAIPCGGCERPAVTRNASNLPVCAECAEDAEPADDDDDGLGVKCEGCPAQAVTRTVDDIPLCRACADANNRHPWTPPNFLAPYVESTDDDEGGSEAGPVVEPAPTVGPRVGDRVTAANVAGLPVGTKIKEPGTAWRGEKVGPDRWISEEELLWNDQEIVTIGAPPVIVELPEPEPKVGDLVTAENVEDLPPETVVEWRTGTQGVPPVVTAVKRGPDHWEALAPWGEMTDDVIVAEWDDEGGRQPPVHIRSLPAPTTTPAPTAKGCHGCRWDRDTACAIPAINPAAPDAAEWSGTHLEKDKMTPRAGAPECPGRGGCAVRAAALLSLLLMADTRSQSVIVVDRPPSIPVPPPPVGPHPPREGPTEDDIRTIERARRRREERKAKRLAAVEAGGERGR